MSSLSRRGEESLCRQQDILLPQQRDQDDKLKLTHYQIGSHLGFKGASARNGLFWR